MVQLGSTGAQGGIQNCNFPCFSIRGFTNSFFDLSGCGACDDANPYTPANTAWDGVFRPWIPAGLPVLGEAHVHWDGCSWTFGRNGGEISGNVHNGKALLGSGAEAGDPMNVSGAGTIITIRCQRDVAEGGPLVIWQGTHGSMNSDSMLVRRIPGVGGGCSYSPEYIGLDKLSGMGCICNDTKYENCPGCTRENEAGDCLEYDCDGCTSSDVRTEDGWTLEIGDPDDPSGGSNGFTTGLDSDGNPDGSPPCGGLNGMFKIRDARSGVCVWDLEYSHLDENGDVTVDPDTGEPHTYPPESRINCHDRGFDDGVWMWHEGLYPHTAHAALGNRAAGGSACPIGVAGTKLFIGECVCAGQSAPGRISYGDLGAKLKWTA